MKDQPLLYSRAVTTPAGILGIDIYIVGPISAVAEQYLQKYAGSSKSEEIGGAIWQEIVGWHEFSGTWLSIGDEVFHALGFGLFKIERRTLCLNPRSLIYWLRQMDQDENLLNV